MRLFCSIAMIVILGLGFIGSTIIDFEGRKAKEPKGVEGFIGTIVAYALIAWIYYGAGAFDAILHD